jgi:exodeoxyribonuclease VII large subunit
MVLKRQVIIKRLEEEGVFTMNKELTFPVIPQRIAVISSKSAAGYTDFINHLKNNSFGYVFYTALFDSAMQGTETEENIINALDRIAVHCELFDVVVIIRGGGSVSDLSWFDNYNIAYHVTQFPVPVITGIGHEKDLSVTDMVAYMALKTPTAVADHLIECIAGAESHLEELRNEITELSVSIIDESRTRLETLRMRLIPMAKLMISGHKEILSGSIVELLNFGKELIVKSSLMPATQKSRLIFAAGHYSTEKNILVKNIRQELNEKAASYIGRITEAIDSFGIRLKILDPVNVLTRGYTITSVQSRIIKSISQISEDDVIDTRFSDGKVKSRVINKIKDKRQKK